MFPKVRSHIISFLITVLKYMNWEICICQYIIAFTANRSNFSIQIMCKNIIYSSFSQRNNERNPLVKSSWSYYSNKSSSILNIHNVLDLNSYYSIKITHSKNLYARICLYLPVYLGKYGDIVILLLWIVIMFTKCLKVE